MEAEAKQNLEEYVWNDMFATINIVQLTAVDLAYYRNIEDFQKRYAQVHSPSMRFNVYAEDSKGVRYSFDGKERTLLDLTFTLNEDMNCKLFQSCKKTKFAAQVPAMSNALGFTNFQGVNAYTKTAVYINILTDKEKGLTYDIHTCDEKPIDKMIDGIPIKNYCSCNSCGQLCNYTLTSSTPVLEGLSWTLIGVFYLCVIIATVGIFFAKKYCGGKQVENRENSLLGGINSRPSALSN